MNITTTQKNNGDGTSNVPEPIRGNAGASVIGPRNPSREAENRDAFLDRIYMATHINVEAIEGAEENRLTYIAVHGKPHAFWLRPVRESDL